MLAREVRIGGQVTDPNKVRPDPPSTLALVHDLDPVFQPADHVHDDTDPQLSTETQRARMSGHAVIGDVVSRPGGVVVRGHAPFRELGLAGGELDAVCDRLHVSASVAASITVDLPCRVTISLVPPMRAIAASSSHPIRWARRAVPWGVRAVYRCAGAAPVAARSRGPAAWLPIRRLHLATRSDRRLWPPRSRRHWAPVRSRAGGRRRCAAHRAGAAPRRARVLPGGLQ